MEFFRSLTPGRRTAEPKTPQAPPEPSPSPPVSTLGDKGDNGKEHFLLADVDTHRYTSLIDPGIDGGGDMIGELDPEQLADREYWMSKGASQQLGDLVATGFISPSDLAMLSTTAGEAKEIEETLGKDGLRRLTSVGTPRRARLRSELLRQQKLKEGEADEGVERVETNIDETNLKGLNPSVMVYYVFMRKAAERRAETRKRRRQIVSLRKEAEINQLHMLMRGAEPVRKRRILARTGRLQPEEELGMVKEGEFYIENDVVVTYFLDPINNRWHRLVGSSRNVIRPATDDRLKATRDPPNEDEIPTYARLLDFTRLESNEFLLCLDKNAQHQHDVHPDWFDYTYPTPNNSPLCQGLCRFVTGWVAPEGLDGVPTSLSLVFDENGEAQPTHHVCKSCGLRLCAKCYKACVDEHHGCVWQLISYYTEWRKEIYSPWLLKPNPEAGAPGAPLSSSMPRTPQSYADFMRMWREERGYRPMPMAPRSQYWDPRTDGPRSSAKRALPTSSTNTPNKKYKSGFPTPTHSQVPTTTSLKKRKQKQSQARLSTPVRTLFQAKPGGPYTEGHKLEPLAFTPRRASPGVEGETLGVGFRAMTPKLQPTPGTRQAQGPLSFTPKAPGRKASPSRGGWDDEDVGSPVTTRQTRSVSKIRSAGRDLGFDLLSYKGRAM